MAIVDTFTPPAEPKPAQAPMSPPLEYTKVKLTSAKYGRDRKLLDEDGNTIAVIKGSGGSSYQVLVHSDKPELDERGLTVRHYVRADGTQSPKYESFWKLSEARNALSIWLARRNGEVALYDSSWWGNQVILEDGRIATYLRYDAPIGTDGYKSEYRGPTRWVLVHVSEKGDRAPGYSLYSQGRAWAEQVRDAAEVGRSAARRNQQQLQAHYRKVQREAEQAAAQAKVDEAALHLRTVRVLVDDLEPMLFGGGVAEATLNALRTNLDLIDTVTLKEDTTS